jgi:hypothetical protein
MRFPHELRNAIPGDDLPGCDRSLILSSIDGAVSHSVQFGGFDMGPRVQLNFRVEESGKLTGVFDVSVSLQVDAARALAATLEELVARLEKPA